MRSIQEAQYQVIGNQQKLTVEFHLLDAGSRGFLLAFILV
jgi:hypothetical protein